MNYRFIAPAILLGTLALTGCCQSVSLFAQAPVHKKPPTNNLDMAEHEPDSLGFSSQRLERLHAVMQQEVDQKHFPGFVTLLARHGKVVETRAYGWKDRIGGTPMTRDTIFRIFSMTKVVTGVAMMILYEEGKWIPSRPISMYIPEFAHLKVFKGVAADGSLILEDPVHPPTMHELMTHTAGFTYGYFGTGPVDRMYNEHEVFDSKTLKGMIDKLAELPLLYQPGTRWVYSGSMDIQGYIIERLSGQSLPQFMEERIFKPLGMVDTGFYVPKEKRGRFATLYKGNKEGETVMDDPKGPVPSDYAEQPTDPSGGGGLVSTAQDYARFAQMLLNGGALDGTRILAPSSVKLMTANHLAPRLLTGEFTMGSSTIGPGSGWGYDCAVDFEPTDADQVVGKGTYFWYGIASTWFWADPSNDLVFVGMTQRWQGPGWSNVFMESRPTIYQALVDPQK